MLPFFFEEVGKNVTSTQRGGALCWGAVLNSQNHGLNRKIHTQQDKYENECRMMWVKFL